MKCASDIFLIIDESTLSILPKEGYVCVDCTPLCLVYFPSDCVEKVHVEAVNDIKLYPISRANQIFLTPVVYITHISANSTEFELDCNKLIVELLKTTNLFNNSSDAYKIHVLFAGTDELGFPEWKELGESSDCKMLEDRIVFNTAEFGLFTVVAQFAFPSECLIINSSNMKHQKHDELTVPELPGFKVKFPPNSVKNATEVKATVYYNDPLFSIKKEGFDCSLASACVYLEPHEFHFPDKIPISIPIPDYDTILEKYPNIQVQLWHISGSESILSNSNKWKLEQTKVEITKDTDGCYFANFDVDHFSGFQLTYDKKIDEENNGADHEYSTPQFVSS